MRARLKTGGQAHTINQETKSACERKHTRHAPLPQTLQLSPNKWHLCVPCLVFHGKHLCHRCSSWTGAREFVRSLPRISSKLPLPQLLQLDHCNWHPCVPYLVFHAKKYCDVLRNTTKYYDVLRNTTTYYEILGHTTTYYDILRRTTKYYDGTKRKVKKGYKTHVNSQQTDRHGM